LIFNDLRSFCDGGFVLGGVDEMNVAKVAVLIKEIEPVSFHDFASQAKSLPSTPERVESIFYVGAITASIGAGFHAVLLANYMTGHGRADSPANECPTVCCSTNHSARLGHNCRRAMLNASDASAPGRGR
jgi:hypothetical protein